MVEAVGIHQVMWIVMLEPPKDRILGVDTPTIIGVATCPVWNGLLTN
jgi:hypothetical protein